MKNVKKLLGNMGDLAILSTNQMNLLMAGDGNDPPPNDPPPDNGGGGGEGDPEKDPPITGG